jgi:hypothetical protein
VERGVNVGMLFEEFHERQIGFLVARFENTVEIAAGLVSVNEESEMELLRHWRGRSL